MLIRVRTNVGMWRVELDISSTTEIYSQSIIDGIAQTRPNVKYTTYLCHDPGCTQPLDGNSSLKCQGIGHGNVVHTRVDPETCGMNIPFSRISNASVYPLYSECQRTSLLASSSNNTTRIIAADGSIQLVPYGMKCPAKTGFRKGMLPLRDMKMQWTLQEFTEMDCKFVFKIKSQEEGWVGKDGVSLDSESANAFQSYLRTFQFSRQRFGLLYGKFIDYNNEINNDIDEGDRKRIYECNKMDCPVGDNVKKKIKKNRKVIVEAIYEPPQKSDCEAEEGLVLLDDPYENNIELLAKRLGLSRVGWIFGHPPREAGFQMSAAEVIMAAEYQLVAGGGVEPTPFVTVKVTVGDDGNASFEAFQVSRQCMEMVAEGAIELGPNPGFCYMNETFTAIQEGRESKTVENNFFLTVIPIAQHSSKLFVSEFPKANRDHDTRTQNHNEMRNQLSKSGTAGWTFIDMLADFNLLIYLRKCLDDADMTKICESVVNRDIQLDEGYRLIIASMAGLDDIY